MYQPVGLGSATVTNSPAWLNFSLLLLCVQATSAGASLIWSPRGPGLRGSSPPSWGLDEGCGHWHMGPQVAHTTSPTLLAEAVQWHNCHLEGKEGASPCVLRRRRRPGLFVAAELLALRPIPACSCASSLGPDGPLQSGQILFIWPFSRQQHHGPCKRIT